MPVHPRSIMANLWGLQAALPLGNAPVGPPALVNVPGFLQQTRSTWNQISTLAWTASQARFLYIDKRTDAEIDVTATQSGYAEVPAGSGTFYRIADVQDIDRGLPDEERRLVLVPQHFPAPLP